MNELEETYNLHCVFIRQHPHFPCEITGLTGEDYIELLKVMYIHFRKFLKEYGQCKAPSVFLENDILRLKKLDKLSLKLAEKEKQILSNIKVDDSLLWAFITVGFNEQTITAGKMATVSKKIANLKYFKECTYVLEKHRENGIHHHTHFLVKLHKKQYPTKLIGWIFGVSGMKDVCLKKDFIDVLGPMNSKKVYQPFDTYYDYIRGVKKIDKQKYIEMDRKWRDANKISHLFETP